MSDVERVARILMTVTAKRPGNFMPDREFPILSMDPDYDDLPCDGTEGVEEDDITQEAVLKLVRTAIEALRTPSPAILKILQESPVMNGYEPYPGRAEKTWQACIDALLT